MKIAVLGSEGRLGNALAKKLLSEKVNEEVLACVCDFSSLSLMERHLYTLFNPLEDDFGELGRPDIIINAIEPEPYYCRSNFGNSINIADAISGNYEESGNPLIIQLSPVYAGSFSQSALYKYIAARDIIISRLKKSAIIKIPFIYEKNKEINTIQEIFKNISICYRGIAPAPLGFLSKKVYMSDIKNAVSFIYGLIFQNLDKKYYFLRHDFELSISEAAEKMKDPDKGFALLKLNGLFSKFAPKELQKYYSDITRMIAVNGAAKSKTQKPLPQAPYESQRKYY